MRKLCVCLAILISCIVFVSPLVHSGSAPPYDQFLARPIPLGTLGSNAAFNTTPPKSKFPCVNEQGTLGALIADQNNNQYILGAAHVLALSSTGYFASGSNEPIVQPSLADAGIGCPPAATGITALTVANLTTVTPISFSKGSVSAGDAALAKVLPGMVMSSQYGIQTFSGTLAGNSMGLVNKGIGLQKFGASTGLKRGKVAAKVLETVKYKICSHLQTTDAAASCNMQVAMFSNVILATSSLGDLGDSGALVLTTDSCPQPVGLYIGGNGTYDFVAAMPGVFSALKNAANGAYSTLSVVPGGAGCQPPAGQIAGYQTPDPDVGQALNVQSDLQNFLAAQDYGQYVDGVGIDLSGSVAKLDIIADDGTVQTGGLVISDAAIVSANLYISFGNGDDVFEGVPFEVSTIQTVDVSQGGIGFSN
jgi:hypothetical protein